jgi:hypothetical protein
MTEENEKRKPLKSFSVGPLSVSLWENDIEGSDRKMKSVTVRKVFTNREGSSDHRSVSINPAEVGCLAGLLLKMEEAVVQQQGEMPF